MNSDWPNLFKHGARGLLKWCTVPTDESQAKLQLTDATKIERMMNIRRFSVGRECR